MSRRRAVTMIELLVAIVIITMALIPFLSVMLWGREKTELTMDQVVAQNRALSYLEYLHSFRFDQIVPPLDLPPGLLPPLEGFTLEADIPQDSYEYEFLPLNATEKVQVRYKVITVKVTWEHMRKPKEMQIADIFVDSL